MIEQLLGDGIYYTYFLRNIRIHQIGYHTRSKVRVKMLIPQTNPYKSIFHFNMYIFYYSQLYLI